ncbi:MAG: CPBP family glutamic-type intramembrane protease [Anaerolineaceae bacterium]|nr:CPBP family glutamic-type intramembrane protease [Anaerolineaceae bacterium]
MPFQPTTLFLTFIWLALILIRFRRSSMVLIAGLLAVGLYTLFALVFGWVTPRQLGLGLPQSWPATIGFAAAGLACILAYSPLADRLASRWFKKPPTLESFRIIQQSPVKLIAGILAAWLLGGLLEELIARGIVLMSVKTLLAPSLGAPSAVGIAICIAAAGAGLFHRYQGPRAMLIIAQLSILFGILFVVSGYNLWAVILCHGFYDTIAFIRFAAGKSKYSHLDADRSIKS